MRHKINPRYDPLAIKEPGTPGYGAGSKQPDAMLAFLKHCYIHISRQQALARCAGAWQSWPGALRRRAWGQVRWGAGAGARCAEALGLGQAGQVRWGVRKCTCMCEVWVWVGEGMHACDPCSR